MTITKPMLVEDAPENIKTLFDGRVWWCTEKWDGIRGIIKSAILSSRNFKPIPNRQVREILSGILPEGSDGELTTGNNIQDCTSGFMSRDVLLDDFYFRWFDYVKDNPKKTYLERIEDLKEANKKVQISAHELMDEIGVGINIVPLIPIPISTYAEYEVFADEIVEHGGEGVILRLGHRPYKFGRSTVREGGILRFKQWGMSEAIVLDFLEKMHNGNEATKDELGRTKRSSHQENKTGLNTLGSLWVRDVHTGEEFGLSGFKAEVAQQIWDNKADYIGKIARYKFMKTGIKKAPRFPGFEGWRSPDDMGEPA